MGPGNNIFLVLFLLVLGKSRLLAPDALQNALFIDAPDQLLLGFLSIAPMPLSCLAVAWPSGLYSLSSGIPQQQSRLIYRRFLHFKC